MWVVPSSLNLTARILNAETDRGRFDLRSMVAGLCDELVPQAAARGIGLRFVVLDCVPAYLEGDGVEFRRMMERPAQSAISLLSRGEVVVLIGSAMPNQHVGRAGTEVSISVEVAGSLPEGVLRVPAHFDDEQTEDSIQRGSTRLRTVDLRARIRVVDSDDAEGRQTARVLAGLGHTVRWVPDVTAARRLLSEEDFELVLVDLHLSSLELFVRWLSASKGLPVLGLRRLEAEARRLPSGIVDWLDKPPQPERLRVMLGRELNITRVPRKAA